MQAPLHFFHSLHGCTKAVWINGFECHISIFPQKVYQPDVSSILEW